MSGIKCNANNMAPTASADPRLGTTVADYHVVALAGRGGMSVVYRARDERLGRDVALKLLAPELTDDEQFRKRFLRESRIAASLNHPNIVPVYAAGEIGGMFYLAMRFVDGADLKALLRRESRLEPVRALALLGQVASALDTAHSHGLVHRDVKPANILLEGNSLETAYLADFGLTKAEASRADATATGQLVGTLDYVAPEQIRGQTLDGRADIYALGCVLYECLTGKPPFGHASDVAVLYAHLHDVPPPASELRPGLPPALDASLARALAKQPEERHRSAGELVADAGEAFGVVGALPSAAPRGWHRRLWPPAPTASRAHRWRLLVVGAALLVVAAVGIGAVLHTRADATVNVIPNSVAVIDPGSNKLVGDIPVGREPSLVAAEGEHAWVGTRPRNLIRIDPDGQRRWPTTNIPLDGPPAALIADRNAAWVVTARGRVKLARFDPRYDEAVKTVGIGPELSTSKVGPAIWGGGLVRTPLAFGNATIWTLGRLDGSLTRRDPTTLVPHSRVELDDFATAIAVGSDAAWVTTKYSGLLRIDPDTDDIVDDFPFPARAVPVDVAVVAHAEALKKREEEVEKVWVVSEGDDVVTRIDPTTREQTPIRVCDGPTAIAYGFDSVWVACKGDGTVWRIDPATTPPKVVAHWELGASPEDIAAGAGAVWTAVYTKLRS
jgi:serine/threonine-protein kinase